MDMYPPLTYTGSDTWALWMRMVDQLTGWTVTLHFADGTHVLARIAGSFGPEPESGQVGLKYVSDGHTRKALSTALARIAVDD